jgi:hypothetical protein
VARLNGPDIAAQVIRTAGSETRGSRLTIKTEAAGFILQ